MGGSRQGNDRVRTMYVRLGVIKFKTDSAVTEKCSRVKGEWVELMGSVLSFLIVTAF